MGSTNENAPLDGLRVRVSGYDKDPESLVATTSLEKRRNASRGNLAAFGRASTSVDRRLPLLLLTLFVSFVLCIGFMASPMLLFVISLCLGMLAFSFYLAQWVLQKDEGTKDMQDVSIAIREGAEGYFRIQYSTIAKMAVVLCVAIYAIYIFRKETREQLEAGLTRALLATLTAASFLFGATCSGIAGYVGMWVSVRANVRVASAARRSAREPLQIAMRSGGFSGLLVVAMTVLGVAILYSFFNFFLVSSAGGLKTENLPLLLVGYGFGASFVALFAQLGGGIYTKAADVGADLVGKVEQGIPEDDPRNPAVIADLVGDNVGDCAARGADLFESIAAEIISAMILGATLIHKAKLPESSGFILFPLVIHTMDLVVSGAGIMSIHGRSSVPTEDPYGVMSRGYNISLALATVSFIASCRWMLYTSVSPNAWMYFAGCGLVGIVTSYIFVWISMYYTDYKYKPVRTIADASTTGHATNIIAGVGLGMESTAMPVLVMSAALVSAYWLGNLSGLVDSDGKACGGLFGTAVATMGMLSTAAYVLTMDMFGPISDNAGGIVEMSQQPESVREITDLLDAVGNTTKATTKGYAIGSAGLASFLLFSAYMDEVSSFADAPFRSVDIAQPEVFIGGLLGACLVYLFTSWSCIAVGKSAQDVVTEVRRQFQDRPGIMTYNEKPDYARCVSIVAASALKEMVRPGILAVTSPCLVGLLFRSFGKLTDQSLLGAKAVAAFLMFATVAGNKSISFTLNLLQVS
eukprot:g4482.t1